MPSAGLCRYCMHKDLCRQNTPTHKSKYIFLKSWINASILWPRKNEIMKKWIRKDSTPLEYDFNIIFLLKENTVTVTFFYSFFSFLFFYSELGTERRTLRLLGKRSTTELNPQPLLFSILMIINVPFISFKMHSLSLSRSLSLSLSLSHTHTHTHTRTHTLYSIICKKYSTKLHRLHSIQPCTSSVNYWRDCFVSVVIRMTSQYINNYEACPLWSCSPKELWIAEGIVSIDLFNPFHCWNAWDSFLGSTST